MNENFKYLFKNTGLLMIGNFSSKILVFLLVPFYTRILTTGEYGVYDLLYSTIQLIFPILSFNIIDGVMRFSIGADKDDLKKILCTGLKYICISIIVLSIGTVLVMRVFHYEILEQYCFEFIMLYASYGIYNLAVQFAKGMEDVKGISIAGVIATVVMIGGNFFFLLIVNQGLRGYFYAFILSFIIPTLFLLGKDRMFEYLGIEILKLKPVGIGKDMVLYSIPLIFNTLSWHINNVADRYAVTWFQGVDVNGIYSVAYKIPAILSAVQVIFIQAWQLSAIKEFDSNKDKQFYNSTYNGCHIVMVLLCSGLICLTRVLAKLLFANDFYEAWIFVPTLLLYIVFNTLSGTVGGIFGAAKDTKTIANTAIAGALVNIVLNFVMVYLWGAEGAAVATVISSIVIWFLRIKASKKYIQLKINYNKHCTAYVLLVVQVIVMSTIPGLYGYIIQGLLFCLLLMLNYNDISMTFFKAFHRKNM